MSPFSSDVPGWSVVVTKDQLKSVIKDCQNMPNAYLTQLVALSVVASHPQVVQFLSQQLQTGQRNMPCAMGVC